MYYIRIRTFPENRKIVPKRNVGNPDILTGTFPSQNDSRVQDCYRQMTFIYEYTNN